MKKILVTGASGGVGYELIKHLSLNGYFVYALDIRKIDEINNVKSFVCDLTKRNEIEKVYDVIKEESKIDAIIHLSGTYMMDSLIEISEDKLKKAFDINVFGAYLVNKVFYNLLNEKAKIVIITSELAPLDPLPFNGIYSLTKSTLEEYAKTLRQELNLKGIDVVIVRPGAIKTSMIDESIREVERIESETNIYKDNAPLFKNIVKKNESKTIEPIKIVKLLEKIINKKRPKLVYSINLNPKLKMLSMLPDRLQLYIIKKMITPKNKK